MAERSPPLDDDFLKDLRKAAEEGRALWSDTWICGLPSDDGVRVYAPSRGVGRRLVPVAHAVVEAATYIAMTSPVVLIRLLDTIEHLRMAKQFSPVLGADLVLPVDIAFLVDLRRAAEAARAMSSDTWRCGRPGADGGVQVYSPSLGVCRQIVPIAGADGVAGEYIAMANPGTVNKLLDMIEQLRRESP